MTGMGIRLTTTSHAILGLLSIAPMSGYDLYQAVQGSIGHFWPISKSQVYAELAQLEPRGLIDGTEVPQERFPDKRVFRLTPAGENQLDRWLEAAQLEAYQFRLPFLLKILFGHRRSPDRTARLLAEIRAEAQARQDEYRSFLAALPAAPYAAYARLAVLYGLRVAEATAVWAEEAGDLLPAERVSIDPRRESRTAPAMFALAPKLPSDPGEAQ
jgi:PadR family transcriptional regulator AphA